MKKTLFLSLLFASYLQSHAQWTAPAGGGATITSGKVGIGATAPKEQLDVTGNIRLNNNSPAENYNGDLGAISFGKHYDVHTPIKLYATTTWNNDLYQAADFRISTLNNSDGISTDKFVLQGRSGNVGIGTTSPNAALEIARGGTNYWDDYSALHISTKASGSIYGPILYLNGNSGTGGRMWGLVSSCQLDAAATGAAGNFAIYDTNGGSRLVINSSGNVGIGTINPDARLAVNGTIHSKEVKVDLTGWSDYVFKPNYNLPSLADVKNYIDKNQHLPDMPSEAEVLKNGVNLGEINKLLLKKVEELTLYLIEQKAEMETIKQQIDGRDASLKSNR